jgi:hypothetical protein
LKNYYVKDAYQDPSEKRNINYLEDKLRTTTQYNDEYIKHDSKSVYKSAKSNNFKNTLKKYEYSHYDDSVKDVITDAKNKNEESIREKL